MLNDLVGRTMTPLLARVNQREQPMKITAVRAFPVWSEFRNLFIVKVETDAGIYGLGERS